MAPGDTCDCDTFAVEMSFEQHRGRRALFDADVVAYDHGRPGYPEAMYDLLRTECGLGPSSRVLEIGPGTGQATGHLLDSGASVTAIELGSDLAKRLQSNFGNREGLSTIVAAFEDVELEPESFDLIVAATSFHWVPVEVGLQRCADALGLRGGLALWWNVFGDPDRPDPFHDALVPVLERLATELLDVPGAGNASTGGPPYALDRAARIREIDASGRFDAVQHETIRWTGRHRPEEIRALFASFSPWLALPPTQRMAVLDEVERLATTDFGGIVERPYVTPIYVTSKVA